MEIFAWIVVGVLSVFGLACWRVMWTGELPHSLRGAAADHGWRRRLRLGLAEIPSHRADPAVVLIVCGLFVGFTGLKIAEADGGTLTGVGNTIAIVGYSVAGGSVLLAVSVVLFHRPRWLIPPYLRDLPDDPDEDQQQSGAAPMKKLIVVAAGFVVATVIPLVLGVDFGRSLIIGTAHAVLYLLLCVPPLPATVAGTVLSLLLMILFIPSDPPTSDLPLNGWEFAWGASAIGAVILVAWHGLDVLRHRLRKRNRR